jgi:hypothetical protein
MNPLTQSKNTTILLRLIPLVLACFALSPSPVLADVVTDWNAIALQTVFSAVPPRPGPSGILDLAMVQAAVHDAIQAFQKRFEPYAVSIPDASGSPVAAAAVAAHESTSAPPTKWRGDKGRPQPTGPLAIFCVRWSNSVLLKAGHLERCCPREFGRTRGL